MPQEKVTFSNGRSEKFRGQLIKEVSLIQSEFQVDLKTKKRVGGSPYKRSQLIEGLAQFICLGIKNRSELHTQKIY